MPARAPFTPETKLPARLVTRPCVSSSAVSSPKYQTLSWESCAYQSVVRSASEERGDHQCSDPDERDGTWLRHAPDEPASLRCSGDTFDHGRRQAAGLRAEVIPQDVVDEDHV